MDEFGGRKSASGMEEQRQNGGRSPMRAESPPPFAHYTHAPPEPVPEIRVTRPSTEAQAAKVEIKYEEEDGGGCCKCTIM